MRCRSRTTDFIIFDSLHFTCFRHYTTWRLSRLSNTVATLLHAPSSIDTRKRKPLGSSHDFLLPRLQFARSFLQHVARICSTRRQAKRRSLGKARANLPLGPFIQESPLLLLLSSYISLHSRRAEVPAGETYHPCHRGTLSKIATHFTPSFKSLNSSRIQFTASSIPTLFRLLVSLTMPDFKSPTIGHLPISRLPDGRRRTTCNDKKHASMSSSVE